MQCCLDKPYVKGKCKVCYMKEYRQKPDQVAKRKKYNAEHYINNKNMYRAKFLKWKTLNKELYIKRTRESWSKFHKKESYKVWLQGYYKNNLSQYAARSAKRRARLIKATPKWADFDKIKEIYKNCPPGHHVDHIVPLKGETVCGLHVEYNLQYLEASENCKKSNKLIQTE